MDRALVYVTSIVAHVAAGALVGRATRSGTRDWYPTLPRAPWSPPTWAFGPAWTLLYALIGASLARSASVDGGPGPRIPWAHALQMALNLAWTPVFFGLRAPGAALATMVALLGAIAWELAEAWRLDSLAGALLVPYAAWVAYAMTLNAYIVHQTRWTSGGGEGAFSGLEADDDMERVAFLA